MLPVHWIDPGRSGPGSLSCRVCGAPEPIAFAALKHRTYRICERCEAMLLDETCPPSGHEEFEHYGFHENDVNDLRYRAFASRPGD